MKQGLLDFDDEETVSSRRKVLFAAVALAVLVLLVYSNSFHCSFHLDDFHSITDNPNIHLKTLTWENIKKTLRSDLNGPEKLYRPVACLSFGLNYYLGGLEIRGYHLLNTVIHYLSSLFLFFFLYQTLRLPNLRERYGTRAYSIALLAASFWAIHPIQTQAVTYVVQRMSSLAGMFYILALYFYARGRGDGEAREKAVFLVASIGASCLAFGSKENAALLPLAIFVYEMLVVQKKGVAWVKRRGPWIIIGLFAFMVLGFVYLEQKRGGIEVFLGGYEGRPFTLGERLLTQPRVILLYLSLLIYPASDRFNIAHSVQVSHSLLSPPSTLAAVVFLAGFLLFLVFMAKRYSLLSFSYLFFLLNHLLESTVFPLEMVFEHRNYIPSMMFFLPPAIAFFHVLESQKVRKRMKSILVLFATVLLVSFGHWTFERNFAWMSEGTLWKDAAAKSPDEFRPRHNLGVYYQQRGYIHEAISEFRKALVSPRFTRRDETIITYYHLGKAYQELGEFGLAKQFYEDALLVKPDLSPALGNLAVLYSLEGNEGLAEEYLEKALKVDADDPYVNFNVGLACLRANRTDEAIHHLAKATKASGPGGRALLYLGIAYKQKGETGRAAAYFRKSAEANPLDITPRLHLVEIHQASGRANMALLEGEHILNVCLRQKPLFDQTLELISTRGHCPDVLLSGEIVLPVLLDVLMKNDKLLEQWKISLGKTIETQGANP